MFEIKIQKTFYAEHAIFLYDQSLEDMHGHQWELEVAVGSDSLDEIEVVMDFHVLEQAVNKIVANYEGKNFNALEPFVGTADDPHRLKLNPTAERIAWWIAQRLEPSIPSHAQLLSVQIMEAQGCYATWKHR